MLFTGTVQTFTAPVDGIYQIECWGAEGYSYAVSNSGGRGSYTSGEIYLSINQKLYIDVGTHAYYTSQGTAVKLDPSSYNTFQSNKSRIMVAASGGNGAYNADVRNVLYGKPGGGLIGFDGYCTVNYSDSFKLLPGGTKGTQTNGGFGYFAQRSNAPNESDAIIDYAGFGTSQKNCSRYYGRTIGPQTYGGTGYYNGAVSWGNGCWGLAGTGSCFISGYPGCNAISVASASSHIIHTNQPVHYSGFKFQNGRIHNGDSYITEPDGSTSVGHQGDGHVRILLIERW